MNDNYLWDKSGQPDAQIQELEEILGTLRYQPKPLKLAGPSTSRRRNYVALLAIAATVLIAVVAGGLWLLLPKYEEPIPSIAYETTPVTPIAVSAPPLSPSPQPPAKRRATVTARHPDYEAIAAKQQLMLALRLASEKLNLAYRRTQTPSQIKNQHRVG